MVLCCCWLNAAMSFVPVCVGLYVFELDFVMVRVIVCSHCLFALLVLY